MWLTDLDTLANIGTILGGIAILFAVFRWLVQRVVKSYTEYLREEIQEVVKQFYPNGGATMRDAIDRVEHSQKTLAAEQSKTAARLAELESKVQ